MKNGLFKEIDGDVWYKNDKYHREGGPAIVYKSGAKVWYQNGLLHRLDGPAVERMDGVKFWYYKNERIFCSSQKEFEKLIKLKLFW